MSWTEWETVAGLSFEDIIYEKKYVRETGAGVARITINRPETLNSVRALTGQEMGVAVEDSNEDPIIGVLVIQGMGDRAFSSGGDVAWEASGDFKDTWGKNPGPGAGQDGSPRGVPRGSKKPVIAAVRGYAIGGGNHMAYMCDFTLAADNAIFGQNGPRIGSPADGTYVPYLTRVVGAKKARELWMLCRRYNAEQAVAMGLANAVVPLAKLDDEVDQWCEEILSLNPDCIQILKHVFDADIQSTDESTGGHGQLSMKLFPDYFQSPGVKEAQEAFFEKRPPNFWQFRKAKDA